MFISSKDLWIFFWNILSRVWSASYISSILSSYDLHDDRTKRAGRSCNTVDHEDRSNLQAAKIWGLQLSLNSPTSSTWENSQSRDQEFKYTDNGQTKHKNGILIHILQHSVQEDKQCLWQSTQEARTWLMTDSFTHFPFGINWDPAGKVKYAPLLNHIQCSASS